MGALALMLGPSAAQALSVHVDGGVLTASVSEALRAERPAIVTADRREDASLWVQVRRLDGALEVVAQTPSGARLVERRIAVDGPLAPALRLVVLLVVEAVDRLEPPSSEPSWGWRFGAQLAGSGWANPGALQLTPGLRAGVAWGPLVLDVLVLASPCCAVESAGVVSATPLSVGGAVEAGYRLAETGPLALLASAGVGLAWRRITGVSLAYAGPAPAETQDAVELTVRATAGGVWQVSARVGLELRAGVELRPTRLRVSLPPPYAGGENAIDPGLISPLIELAVMGQIF